MSTTNYINLELFGTQKPTTNLNNLISDYSLPLTFIDGLGILLLSIICGFFLKWFYKKYVDSYSSKENFGNTIVIIIISVSSLIAIIKSSLALSLGLVGALSVVRYRTAVKEPYNLAFLLLSICIAIGLGSGQFLFALMTLVTGVIAILSIYNQENLKRNYLKSSNDLDTLIISLPKSTELTEFYKILDQNLKNYEVISLDENGIDPINISLRINLKNLETLDKIRKSITEKWSTSSIRFYSSPF